MARKKKRKFRWRLLKWMMVVLAIAVCMSVALVLPLRWVSPPTSSFMLQDDSGRIPVYYEWTDWDRLGTSTALAVVASEDQKFAQHFGLDVGSIADSIEDAEDGGRMRGASTISQQVAKNLYLWPGRSLVRKGIEAYLAVMLEICLPKRRILEIYLNIAEFGPGIYGVAPASEHFFGKEASTLSDREAALLAAVLPNPIAYHAGNPSEYLRERQQWIITQMARLRREQWLQLLDQASH